MSSKLKKLWDLIKDFFLNITVEPIYLTFSMSFGLYAIVSSELYIQKVCKVNLAFGDEICDNIQQHKDEQVQVQKYVSQLRIYNSILQAFPSVIFALFAGPWSDTNGRKMLIISSVFGYVISNAVYMINSYFFYELKAEYLLFECLQDCTGGFVTFFMSVNAYMADITSEKTRTKRVAFMTGLWPIGMNIGKALSGVIKDNLGFMYNFGLGMLLAALSGLYVIVFVKDSVEIRKQRLEREGYPEGYKEPEASEKSGIRTLFNLDNVKMGVKALLKKRPHNIRLYLLLMIACFEMEMFINVGEWSGGYLYLRRVLEWTMTDYTRFSTIVGVIGICAQYIFIPLLSQKAKLHDATIVLIDITGCLIQTIILACAVKSWMVYLGACIAFLDATSFSMIRCMISKHVDPDEIGKILSFVGAFQAFIPIIASPIFGTLYRSTVESFPQAYLVVLSCLFLIDWCVLVFIGRGVRKIAKIWETERKHEAEMDQGEKSVLNEDGQE